MPLEAGNPYRLLGSNRDLMPSLGESLQTLFTAQRHALRQQESQIAAIREIAGENRDRYLRAQNEVDKTNDELWAAKEEVRKLQGKVLRTGREIEEIGARGKKEEERVMMGLEGVGVKVVTMRQVQRDVLRELSMDERRVVSKVKGLVRKKLAEELKCADGDKEMTDPEEDDKAEYIGLASFEFVEKSIDVAKEFIKGPLKPPHTKTRASLKDTTPPGYSWPEEARDWARRFTWVDDGNHMHSLNVPYSMQDPYNLGFLNQEALALDDNVQHLARFDTNPPDIEGVYTSTQVSLAEGQRRSVRARSDTERLRRQGWADGPPRPVFQSGPPRTIPTTDLSRDEDDDADVFDNDELEDYANHFLNSHRPRRNRTQRHMEAARRLTAEVDRQMAALGASIDRINSNPESLLNTSSRPQDASDGWSVPARAGSSPAETQALGRLRENRILSTRPDVAEVLRAGRTAMMQGTMRNNRALAPPATATGSTRPSEAASSRPMPSMLSPLADRWSQVPTVVAPPNISNDDFDEMRRFRQRTDDAARNFRAALASIALPGVGREPDSYGSSEPGRGMDRPIRPYTAHRTRAERIMIDRDNYRIRRLARQNVSSSGRLQTRVQSETNQSRPTISVHEVEPERFPGQSWGLSVVAHHTTGSATAYVAATGRAPLVDAESEQSDFDAIMQREMGQLTGNMAARRRERGCASRLSSTAHAIATVPAFMSNATRTTENTGDAASDDSWGQPIIAGGASSAPADEERPTRTPVQGRATPTSYDVESLWDTQVPNMFWREPVFAGASRQVGMPNGVGTPLASSPPQSDDWDNDDGQVQANNIASAVSVNSQASSNEGRSDMVAAFNAFGNINSQPYWNAEDDGDFDTWEDAVQDADHGSDISSQPSQPDQVGAMNTNHDDDDGGDGDEAPDSQRSRSRSFGTIFDRPV